MTAQRRRRRERPITESLADLGPAPAGYVSLDESEAAQVLGFRGGAFPPVAAEVAGPPPAGYVPLSETKAACLLGPLGEAGSSARSEPLPAPGQDVVSQAGPAAASGDCPQEAGLVRRLPTKVVSAQLSAENPIAPPLPLAEVARAQGVEPPDPWRSEAPAAAPNEVAANESAPSESAASEVAASEVVPAPAPVTDARPLSRKERLAQRRAETGATRFPTRRELRATGALVIVPADDEPSAPPVAPEVPIPPAVAGYRTIDATGELTGVLPLGASTPGAAPQPQPEPEPEPRLAPEPQPEPAPAPVPAPAPEPAAAPAPASALDPAGLPAAGKAEPERAGPVQVVPVIDWPRPEVTASGQIATVVTGQFPRPMLQPKDASFDEVIAAAPEPANPASKHLSARQLVLMVVLFIVLGLVIWFAVTRGMHTSLLFLPVTPRLFKGLHDRL